VSFTIRAGAHNNWRLWAALPPEVRALVLSDRDGHISAIGRPEFPAGVCRTCGCVERDACVDAIGECCAWADASRTLCTFCRGGVRRRKSGQR